ncbi:MAG: ABC1 kinase family protein, partial [Acidimicrobiales bacterium]
VRRRLGPLVMQRVRRRTVDPVDLARPMRKTFADLGACYVKFGQLVASAPSVFGPEVSAEFRSLLDQGRAVPFGRVRAEVERATGRRLEDDFADFDPEPIGRASVAVVHRARLHDGREVAVKVLRPGIEGKVSADLAFMAWLVPRLAARVADAHPDGIRPMISGLRQQLCEELDLRNEGRMMDHFHRVIQRIDLPLVAIPSTCPELSGRRVLVMEYLDGAAIDDLESIEAFGVDPEPLVSEILKAFFLTAVRFGVFHADVHAGNLLLLRDGRIGILDWGIVGRLDAENVEHLRSVIRAALGDEEAWDLVVARIVDEIGPVVMYRLGIGADELPGLIRGMLEPVLTRPFGEVNLSTLLTGPAELAGDHVPDGDAPEIDPDAFDRDMFLLTKQLLFFERYGQLYLSHLSLLSDREFFAALVSDEEADPAST